MVLRILDRACNVDHGQKAEDERLQKRHEDLQWEQEADGEGDHDGAARQPEKKASQLARQRPAEEPAQPREQENDGESTRARWLTTSMGNISGASHGTGPQKCFR